MIKLGDSMNWAATARVYGESDAKIRRIGWLFRLWKNLGDNKLSEDGCEDWMRIRLFRMMDDDDDDDDDEIVGRRRELGSGHWILRAEYDKDIRMIGLARLSKGPGDGSNV